MTDEDKPARGAAFVAAFRCDQARHAVFFADGVVDIWPGRARPWVACCHWADVDLEKLSADWPGRGWAGAAMRRLVTLADLHAVSVFVVARSYHRGAHDPTDGTLGQQALVAFYARHGFEAVGTRNGNTYMLRPCRRLDANGREQAARNLAEPPQWRGLPMPGENTGQPGAHAPQPSRVLVAG